MFLRFVMMGDEDARGLREMHLESGDKLRPRQGLRTRVSWNKLNLYLSNPGGRPGYSFAISLTSMLEEDSW
jgi:hypothetical protein